jgi:hypothetical protein
MNTNTLIEKGLPFYREAFLLLCYQANWQLAICSFNCQLEIYYA